MNSKITIDRSLMYVQQYQIDKFCSIAERMRRFWYIIGNRKNTSEADAWSMVFNAWLILLPDESRIIQSVEKSIYYSPNLLIFEAVKRDKAIQSLKRRSSGNEELNFLLSLKIAIVIGTWAVSVLEKYHLMDIIDRNKTWVNYESHNSAIIDMDSYLKDQARFTKAVVEELNSTNTFQELIKKCCSESYALFVENFGKSQYDNVHM
ncbi:hypothetical protein [Lysinibacillus sp. BW-2-10]|uniref:hypothetical protein n=1 Tax=Lysinibacillus sp. BW-2-10 TaxID=2590030 RepID=UPI00117F1C3F|nr:hypothetical protein [Lysinibacillus sp. BW-2-10]TSI05464.1 hypothetical protein FJQ64_12065 [Lysinibacillus sp. BW-2-10]